MPNPFFIGGYYRDRRQSYEVIDMSATGMVVRYEDGTQERIGSESMAIKARIYYNMLAEFRVNHPILTDDYFWSIGFLAGNSRFEAELPNQVVAPFLDQYSRLSGENLVADHPLVISLGEVDKWGPELRIYFPTPPRDLDFGPGIEVRAGQTDAIKRINNNSFWNKLVRIGFRIGKNHDVNLIKNSIPPEKREHFEKGLNS